MDVVLFSAVVDFDLLFGIADMCEIKVQKYTFFSFFQQLRKKNILLLWQIVMCFLMKKLCNALIFGLLFLWQLPQNLVALVWLAAAGPAKKIACRHYNVAFAARMPKGAGGVSLGTFAIVSHANRNNQRVIRHELDGHTVDSKLLGPLYLLVVGLPSALHLLWYNKFGKGRPYDDFYTERRANRHAGLK